MTCCLYLRNMEIENMIILYYRGMKLIYNFFDCLSVCGKGLIYVDLAESKNASDKLVSCSKDVNSVLLSVTLMDSNIRVSLK